MEPTRRERLEAEGIDTPEMPECDAMYMVTYFFEVGPSMPTGMGEAPIAHSEIAAWMDITGTPLNTWEARTLRRLSIDYVNESQQATKRGHPAPWKSDAVDVDKAVAANAQKNAFRELAKL